MGISLLQVHEGPEGSLDAVTRCCRICPLVTELHAIHLVSVEGRAR